jgi:NAD(P)-dependent dehydrogenase (short-subunit alcohol dehydrogenase family)
VSRESEIETLFERVDSALGLLTVLVNNAGVESAFAHALCGHTLVAPLYQPVALARMADDHQDVSPGA